MTKQITLEIPSESLLSLKLMPDEMAQELRLAAAMKLYELGKLSSGAAATLAGIPKPLFLMKLTDYGIDSFDLSEEAFGLETRLA
jgi:predicted HTH domain antitoxin